MALETKEINAGLMRKPFATPKMAFLRRKAVDF